MSRNSFDFPGAVALVDDNALPTKSWVQVFQRWQTIIQSLQESGTTARRPTNLLWIGRRYFDTTLGTPVWLQSVKPSVWVTYGGGGGATPPAGADTQIQFNDAGAFGASASFTWAKTTNVLTLGSAATPALVTTPVGAANTSGVNLTIKTGAGTGTGSGAVLNLNSGLAGATGAGGLINITSGAGGATSGAGGAIAVTAGNSTAGNSTGGAINITAGSSTGTGQGASANVIGGVGGTAAGSIGGGGAACIGGNAGVGSGGDGGAAGLFSGNADGAGQGGTIQISAGSAGVGAGQGGNIQLTPGVAGDPSGFAGHTYLSQLSPLATTAKGGFVVLNTCAGVPTGVVGGAIANTDAPIIYDTTNHKLWIYTQGVGWKGVVLA